MSSKKAARSECPRRSLNEVLVAELTCLRPWPAHLTPAAYVDPKSHPAECALNEQHRAGNLREIYTQIGDWSGAKNTQADLNPDPSGSYKRFRG